MTSLQLIFFLNTYGMLIQATKDRETTYTLP